MDARPSMWGCSSGWGWMPWCSTRTTCRVRCSRQFAGPGFRRWRSWTGTSAAPRPICSSTRTSGPSWIGRSCLTGTTRLAGLDYVLLRDEILALRPEEPPAPRQSVVPKVFAFFGGTDAYGAGPYVVQALAATGVPFEATVVAPGEDLAEAIAAVPLQPQPARRGDRSDLPAGPGRCGGGPGRQCIRYVDLGAHVSRGNRRPRVRRGQPGAGLRASSRHRCGRWSRHPRRTHNLKSQPTYYACC